ncbi:MAG: damage-control phosphatase ARMT1 family protein [Chloroflexota bacterium]|nr:damage-control phosphatase ARMT1 family protein [Chloroflexota bacterium]
MTQLPPLLMTCDPGSFARKTIVERKPQIIRQVGENNDYSAAVMQALAAFRDEIAGQAMQPLREQAPDVAAWNRELFKYTGKTWLEVPWYWAEVFFYRKLLEAVRYFQPGPWLARDPFACKKQQQTEAAIEQLAKSWTHLDDLAPELVFEALLHSSLWGNRADLSNFTVRQQASGGLATHAERQNILIDDTEAVRDLLSPGTRSVAFINDNVGLDVLFDLALADFLLTRGWTRQVVFHLKDYPFFVSDAMPEDIGLTLQLLQASPEETVSRFGDRLDQHLSSGQLELRDNPFWTSFHMFSRLEATPSLQTQLERADLVIIKGDVNYRRLLDDRHWPFTTAMRSIAGDFPAPFVALRTLKGEIMVGLPAGKAEELHSLDPGWLINGKRGVIHYMNTAVQE